MVAWKLQQMQFFTSSRNSGTVSGPAVTPQSVTVQCAACPGASGVAKVMKLGVAPAMGTASCVIVVVELFVTSKLQV